MTRPFLRLLGDGATDNPDALPTTAAAGLDFILILTAILCAVICLLGLIAVARCACLRRLSQPQSPSASKANRGLKKKILRSIPKITFAPDSASKLSDCAICIAEFAAGDEIRVLPQCGHAFHVICIDIWLESHSSCPSCRQILAAADTYVSK